MATEQILTALIEDVMTNPQLKHAREFYGTPEDNRFALVDNSALPWPEWFQPQVPGQQLIRIKDSGRASPRKQFRAQNRLLGIHLSNFELQHQDGKGPEVLVVLFNAGGHAIGAVIGSCFAHYSVQRTNNRWSVELDVVIDP